MTVTTQLVMPEDCVRTQCPVLDREYISHIAESSNFDIISLIVIALARRYRTHLLTVREDGVHVTPCEENTWLRDAVDSVMNTYYSAYSDYLDCVFNLVSAAGGSPLDAVAKAGKECINRFVNSLSRLDEGYARSMGMVYMRDLSYFINKVLKEPSPRMDKVRRMVDEVNREATPLMVGLLEKALTRALSQHTVISVHVSPTMKVLIVAEDGKSRTLQLGPFDTVESTYDAYKRLAEYFPSVFAVGCREGCPHASLARLVHALRKDRDFPLLARLVTHYLLRDEPAEARERVAEALSTPESVLKLIAVSHSVEVGHVSLVDHIGNTPICISILTCNADKDLLKEFINEAMK